MSGGAALFACAVLVECAAFGECADFAGSFFRFLRVDFVVFGAVVAQGSWA